MESQSPVYCKGENVSGSECGRDYSGLANKIQTAKMKKFNEDVSQKKQQLDPKQYWKANVKSIEDAMQYYEIYHPEYPKFLQHALAQRCHSLVERMEKGQEIDLKFMKQEETTDAWDYKAELLKNGIKV